MKGGFYSRMALEGIRKNRQLYLPYLMTCALMPAVFYILDFLYRDELVQTMRGSSSVGFVLMIFGVVNHRLFLITNLIGVGTVVLFYTLVYRITGNAYYTIVSGGNEKL